MVDQERKIDLFDEGTMIVGLDECNHGRYPEFFVAAASNTLQDGFPLTPMKLNKRRVRKPSPLSSMGLRKYTFLEVIDGDYGRIRPKENFIGTVATSLIHESIGPDLDQLILFIDGTISTKQMCHTKDMLADYTPLKKTQIHITGGPKYDEIYPIVNLADSIANSLWKMRGEENSRREKHRRDFLRD